MSSEEESTNEYESEEEVGSEEEVEEEPKPKKRAKPKKDPNKPKRNMSAFFLYSNANRARIKEENPGIAFGKVAQKLSVEFKKLDAEERSDWDEAAARDKERYQEEMKSYEPPSDEEDYGGRRKKKAKKDPNKPKRNMSAFFLYSNAVRSTVKEENPEAKFGDIAKIISVQFKALSDSERAKYNKLAAEDKVRYQEAMVDYNANN